MARVAIVTGGTRGIGRAICEALQGDGFTVVANYAGNEEKARAFTQETGIPAYRWDVGDHERLRRDVTRTARDNAALTEVLIIAAAFFDGPAQGALWAGALMLDYVGPVFGRGRPRKLRLPPCRQPPPARRRRPRIRAGGPGPPPPARPPASTATRG